MMTKTQLSNRKWLGWAVGAALLIVALLVSTINNRVSEALRRASFDWAHDLASWIESNDLSSNQMMIIYIDETSHKDLNQPLNKPWSRALHAQLLNQLTEDVAQVVVFDIVFSDEGPDAAADVALAQAMRRNGRVVLAADLLDAPVKTDERVWVQETTLTLPYAPFREAARAWGFSQLQPDEDFLVREHCHGLPESDAVSLSWATGTVLGLAATKNPGSRYQERWINYYGRPGMIPTISYKLALTAPKGFFANKIVLIGGKAMTGLLRERRDEFRSPYTMLYRNNVFVPAVDIHATVLQNLIRQDWLRRLSPAMEYCIFLGAALFFGWFVSRHSPARATGLAVVGVCAVALLAILLVAWGRYWFPWLTVVLIQAPLGLLSLFLLKSTEWFIQRRVALRRIREQATLLDKAQDAIMVHASDGQTTYWNPSAQRIYGWTESEIQDRGVVELLHDGDLGRFKELYAIALNSGWIGELEQTTRTGRKIIVESRWSPLFDDKGSPAGILVINTDVSERKKMELQLRHAERMKIMGTLASGLAHDLNNVLTPILATSQILQLGELNGRQKTMLSTIEISGKRGADMAREMLAFARGYDGEKLVLNPKHIIREVVKIGVETVPKNVTVEVFIAPDLGHVKANATQLHQVLLNLLLNAKDAMPDGGTISVHAANSPFEIDEKVSPCVVIRVSDTGCGIAPEIADHIFDPFFTTKEVGKGTGLGLATVRGIVTSHHGKVDFVTQAGKGTTFSVALPRTDQSPTEQPALATVQTLQGCGQTVIVIDPDPLIRAVVEVVLERHNYNVIQCETTSQAMEVGQSVGQIAIVLADGAMMEAGDQTLRLSLLKIDSKVRFILLCDTGCNLESENPAQADAFLEKPFNVPRLLETVARVLGT